MSAPNPASFRLPVALALPPDIHPAVRDNLRLLFNGLLDAHQAINVLNARPTGQITTTVTNVTAAAAAAAAAAQLSFNQIGFGSFAGAGLTDLASCFGNSNDSVITNYPANTVVAVQFNLMATFVISSCSYSFSATAGAGNTANFGIFDLRGNKLIEAIFDETLSSVQTKIITPATAIGPGTFYLGYSTSDTTTAQGPAVQPGSVPAQILALFNAVNPLIATAANPMVANVLPTTLGTLTATTTPTWNGFPLCIWAV